jgi:2'-5' RNA ligase
MTTAEPTSGVVARVPLPGPLERIRHRHDLAAAAGAPAHVTLLFPFVPVDSLGQEVRRGLAEVAAGCEPFEVRFEAVGRFPGVVYLAPEPAAPFAALTAAIAERFPAYPPYGGAFDAVIPHLTLTESATAPLDDIALTAERHLPFAHRVASFDLLLQGPDGRWQSHWRLPLGVRR